MVWWIIILIIMSAISFILNGLFLFVLARNKDLVKRKRITYHVANIAVADTLFGLGSFCYIIVWLHRNEVTYETVLLFQFMWNVGYFASQAAVLLMTIERSIVIAKPLKWNEILPRKRMLLFMICSWIAVVTLLGVYHYFRWKQFNEVYYTKYFELRRKGNTVELVMYTLHTVFLLSAAAVNIYMFKKLRKKDGLADSQQSTRQLPQAGTQQKSMHLKRKASKLVLLLAGIMIITCLPTSLQKVLQHLCIAMKLRICSMDLENFVVFYLLRNLNFIVNPLVYIWKDRIYRNAFYRTFKFKTAQF